MDTGLRMGFEQSLLLAEMLTQPRLCLSHRTAKKIVSFDTHTTAHSPPPYSTDPPPRNHFGDVTPCILRVTPPPTNPEAARPRSTARWPSTRTAFSARSSDRMPSGHPDLDAWTLPQLGKKTFKIVKAMIHFSKLFCFGGKILRG